MHYHQNHMWCSQSHWNDKDFSSSYSVTINKYKNHYGENENDEKRDELDEDWSKLIEFYEDEDYFDVPVLKQEIIDWLEQIIPDIARDYYGNGTLKSWCYGNVDYRSRSSYEFSIWFSRKRDAMKFIKEFSVHKKPTTYYNHFNYDRKKLVDGKLVKY